MLSPGAQALLQEEKHLKWFEDHPSAWDDGATVRPFTRDRVTTYFKRTLGGRLEVAIDQDEFAARHYASTVLVVLASDEQPTRETATKLRDTAPRFGYRFVESFASGY